jgi:hypothetical protein
VHYSKSALLRNRTICGNNAIKCTIQYCTIANSSPFDLNSALCGELQTQPYLADSLYCIELIIGLLSLWVHAEKSNKAVKSLCVQPSSLCISYPQRVP